MNWLTEIVRPKIKKTTPKEIADNLWVRCPNCNQMLFSKELKDSHYVCTACGHHLRLYVEKRFKLLFDDEKYTLAELPTDGTPSVRRCARATRENGLRLTTMLARPRLISRM